MWPMAHAIHGMGALIGLLVLQEASTPDLPKAGSVREDDHEVAQVWAPPGEFQMGAGEDVSVEVPAWAERELQSERPSHPVKITQGFWIDRTEVTVEAFRAFTEDGGYFQEELWSEEGRAWLKGQNVDALPARCLQNPKAREPQVCVTWFEAQAYAAWRGGRLPTEAEWEWAARGPESRVFPWGNQWDPDRAHVVGAEGPREVGSYPDGASWIGALDMAGNVMEWVSDWLDVKSHERTDAVDPQGPTSGRVKVEKGGWWGAPPFTARSSYRHFEDPPGYRDAHIGFRVLTEDPRSSSDR